MKHFKRLIPSILAFALVSCAGNGDVAGRYKFQLGSDKGTHVGIFMDLTKEEVHDAQSELLGNKFVLTVDMKGMDDSSQAPTSESTNPDQVSGAAELSDHDFTMSGYYTLKNIEGLNVVNLGTTLIEDFFDATIKISPEIVEKILYAYIEGNTLTCVIPVSLNDLAYQLYWYGYRIDIQKAIEESSIFDLIPEILPESMHHQIGTHPEAKDISDIKTYEAAKGITSNMFEDFRDYHVLSMGLAK